MKLRHLLPLLLFAVISVNAQDDPGPGTVTVYSEDGENFTLYLNGNQKNAVPMSRVVVPSVTEVPIAFRIVFQNTATAEITKRGLRQGTNCLYSIEKNRKGERGLKVKGCTNDAAGVKSGSAPATDADPAATLTPDQLNATYSNGVITINDGRKLNVQKVKAMGMTYPRLMMTALPGAHVSISYDGNAETYSSESPLEYQVKDFSLNNSYFTMTVNEGGPTRTWHVKLQNSNGYDLKIE